MLRPLRAAVADWRPTGGGPGDPLSAISLEWASIVGAEIARNCRPVALTGTTLLVATTSSAWSQQLQLLCEGILEGVRAIPGAGNVSKMRFRSASFRAAAPSEALPATPVRARPAGRPPEPASDPLDALDRVRRRILAARRDVPLACSRCNAPMREGLGTCAPCAARELAERRDALQRAMYETPWLAPAQLLELFPQTSRAELEAARRALLVRWWTMLQRARRAGRVSRSGIERRICSSYVILASGLSPDQISPAVIRNALGAELDTLLFGTSGAESTERVAKDSRS